MSEDTADYYEMSLAQIREHKGFSRRALSQMTGISEDTLYLIEKKGQMPRADTIVKLCITLGINPKQLLHSIGLDVSQVPNGD